MDLAQVVIQAFDLEPVGLRGDHAPAGQVVQGGAPEHRLFATGVHGDIAADGGGILRGGVDREGQAMGPGQIRDPAGDQAGTGAHRGHRAFHARQLDALDRRERLQLFGVDHGAMGVEGYRRTRVTGAAAARYQGQATVDAGLYDRGNLVLMIG